MSPLPWLERWLPVLLPLLTTLLVAGGIRAPIARLAPSDRRAAWAAALGVGAFGLLAGHDALGPDLGGDAHRTLGWLFGATLALLGTGLALRRTSDGRRSIAATVFGLALGLLPAAGWLAAERALAFEDVDAVSPERARWRRRLAPSDPRPWLALGLQARAEGQDDHALAMADVAETLRPDDDRFLARILELRCDVHAAEGDCERARALFQEALEARARAAMESLDLDLSESYRLPPAFAAECRLDE